MDVRPTLSVRLAEALVAAQDRDTHVIVMTPGAADELVALVEAAEAVVATYEQVLSQRGLRYSQARRDLAAAISRFQLMTAGVQETMAALSRLQGKL